NLFFLGALLFAQLESDVKRRAISLAFALRFEGGQLRFANLVVAKIQNRFLVVALDWKNFFENRLKAMILAFGKRDVFLEEIDVRVELDFNEVWKLDSFLDCSEVDAFRISF